MYAVSIIMHHEIWVGNDRMNLRSISAREASAFQLTLG
jgi:hypothetical protein